MPIVGGARPGRQLVDWGEQTLRAGDWVCHQHGRIEPRTDTLVPSCPHCGALALHATLDRQGGYLTYPEPAPTHCADPDRHRLGPGRVLVGWRACHCPPVVAANGSGHRSWSCRACPDVQEWPPHEGPPPADRWHIHRS